MLIRPARSADALAVETSERQRARSLLDLLSEARADVRQGVDAALLERERSLGRQLNDKAQRLAQVNKPEQSAALKQEISLPIHLHTHDTSGAASATIIAAVEAGVDAVDAAMDAFSGTTSQPTFGSLAAALADTDRDPGRPAASRGRRAASG